MAEGFFGYYSGFADEAGDSIEAQIRATQALGWHAIEARNIDGVNITDLSAEQFDRAFEKLQAAGIRIDCVGSTVANWGKHPRQEEDFQSSVASLERALPRMRRLGTTMLRGMSFAIVKDEPPDSPELEEIIFEKLRRLVQVCADAGVTYLHENCSNYGGLSYRHTLRLLDQIQSPCFKLVFDTGNPVGMDSRTGVPPYAMQSSWEFYSHVKPFIARIHIKDCNFVRKTDGIFPERQHTFPGEGQGDVRRILADLLQNGYDGALSIEPHMGAVYHTGEILSPEEMRFSTYVEYGRRLEKLVAEVLNR